MIGSVLILAILDLAVVVDGAVSCPAPEVVARELDELMPVAEGAREPDIAELSREGTDLHIELRRGDGSWIAVRNVAGGRGCADLAKAAAVVIAAWEAELAPGVAETVNLAPPPPVRRRSRRFGSAMLAMAPPMSSVPPMPAIVSTRRAAPARVAPPQAEFSMGLGGVMSGGNLATVLLVDAFARLADGPLALRFGLELTSSHRNELGADLGSIEWRHSALDAGVRYRATTEDTFFDLHSSLKLAALNVDLLTPTSPDTVSTMVADYGLATGMRLGFGTPGRRRVLPWVGLDLTVWGRNTTVAADTFKVTLPNLDVGVSVGFLGGPRVKHSRPQSREPAAGEPRIDLDALYRDHARAVARWVRRLGGPWLDGEDAVHEVFLVAQRRLREFRGDARVTTWLYRITERVVRHHRRRDRLRRWLRRGPRDEVTFATAGRARLTPVEELERRESSATVYRVLDRLPDKYRTVLVLFELERASGEEIAELTATKVATVWVRLHRARALFLDRLQRLERDGRIA